MINILVVDDHEIFIEALVSLLDSSGVVHVVAKGSNGREALTLMEDHPDVDVLVLDVSMPVMDGVEAVFELRKRGCAVPILMLTQEIAGGTIARALKAGASGYVLKTAGREEFLTAITTVAAGSEYISEAATAALVQKATGREGEGEHVPLTRREYEVLRLVVAGKTTNQIADALFISPYTAESHRRNLLQKLRQPNASALVRYAIENGLVEP
jgi:DNA-binding NarL/FixJ family response regulator